jgi:hypothetical protein
MSFSSIERECGKIPSSMPIMKTARNSRPFALWIVISVTRPPSSSRIASCAEKSEISCRNDESVGSAAVSCHSCATPTSSCRFSFRPWASTVRSFSSASM